MIHVADHHWQYFLDRNLPCCVDRLEFTGMLCHESFRRYDGTLTAEYRRASGFGLKRERKRPHLRHRQRRRRKTRYDTSNGVYIPRFAITVRAISTEGCFSGLLASGGAVGKVVTFGQRSRWARRGWRLPGRAFILSTAGAVLLGAVYGWSTVPYQTISASFPICQGTVRTTCVVDGDTFWLDGIKYRITDIDTPEIGEPKCAWERELGERAKYRLQMLLNDGPFALSRGLRDDDKYGRKLRTVHRDGRSLGETLVDEGLAHRWIGHKQSWCG